MTAKQFRDWYESRNLTQDEVAGLLGVYRNRVSRMATGKVPVSRQTARMLWVCQMQETTEHLRNLRLGKPKDRPGDALRRLSNSLDNAESACSPS